MNERHSQPQNKFVLNFFQSNPIIDFGNVIIGRSESQILQLINEFDYPQTVTVATDLSKSPFKVSFTSATVESNRSIELEIVWSPMELGNVFETLACRSEIVQFRVKLVGSAIEPQRIANKSNMKKDTKGPVRKPVVTGATLVNKTKNKNKSNKDDNKENALPLPISNINTKPPQPLQSRRIISSSNDFCNEAKAIMTESNNYYNSPQPVQLAADNSFDSYETWLTNQEDRFKKWLNHIFRSNQYKTKPEAISQNLSEYIESAKRLSERDSVKKVLLKIQTEIANDKVCMKSQLMFKKNGNDYKELVDLIMNYSNIWVFLACETLFKISSTFDINNDTSMRDFIGKTLLWSTKLAQKYKVTSSNYWREEFNQELNRYVLSQCFSLIYFLDVAKRENILPLDVILFKENSSIKSSSNIVLKFNCCFIKGEGSILKKLSNWGCVLSHEQMVLDEFDYTVSNLHEDLTDGIRLAKLAQILVATDIMSQLRLPVVDRLRKEFNIKLAIKTFEEANTLIVTYSGEKIDFSSILDGHREKTLALLWCILSTHHIDAVIERDKLIEEIKKLNDTISFNISGKELLLTWVKEVGKIYNMEVENISDLSDGRALCLLIHHYLPENLKLTEIRRIDGIDYTDDDFKTIQRYNYRVFFEKVKQIGGIPLPLSQDLIPSYQLINTTLAFFSSRLIDLMKLYRSANCIQRAWKKYRDNYLYKTYYMKYEREIIIVQSFVRRYLQLRFMKLYKLKVTICQSVIRRYFAVKQFNKTKSAIILLQKHCRGLVLRKKFLIMKKSAITIQKYFRGFSQRIVYKRYLSSTIVLQKYIRGYLVRKDMKQRHEAATRIQRFYLTHKNRNLFINKRNACLILQKNIRRLQARIRYIDTRNKIILIQSVVRKYLLVQKFNRLKRATLLIQKTFKGFITRKSFLKQKESALKIQTTFRKYYHQQRYLKMRQSSIVIQKNIRRYLAKKSYSKKKAAAICLQKNIRRYLIRKEYLKLKSSAIVFQKHIRRYLVIKMLKRRQSAAIIIQKNLRSSKVRKQFLLVKASCITIQRYCRGYLCLNRYRTTKKSVIMIQKHWRGVIVRRMYKETIECIITIQKNIRSYIIRQQYIKIKQSSIIIQKYTRKYLIQKNYRKTQSSIILIQKTFRKYIARKRYLEFKQKVITIQKHIRSYLSRREYQRQLSAIITVQSLIRKTLTQTKYKRMKNAAILIQKTFRCYITQKHFQNQRNSAIILQKYVRGFLLRQKFLQLRNASTIIGKHVRGYLARKYFEKNKETMRLRNESRDRLRYRSAIVIQTAFRRYIQTKLYHSIRHSIVFVQLRWKFKFYQKIKATLIIQKFVRKIIFQKNRINAAITIQRIWRGRKVRLNLKKKPIGREIEDIRTRFIAANRRFSKYNTVRYIGVKALEDLKHNCSISKILCCLNALEKVTSLSREICKWLYESDAYNILINLMKDCNRGEADLEVVSKSISVLFNLAKAEVFNLEIIGSEFGQFLKELLVRTVNAKRGTKGVTIFCHTCLLLLLLIRMERRPIQDNQDERRYSICNDIKTTITDLRQNIVNRYEYSNSSNSSLNTYSEKILDQMRLNPSWDLRRKKHSLRQNPVPVSLKKTGSTISLQETKASSKPTIKIDVFRKPLDPPQVPMKRLPRKSTVVESKPLHRSVSVSNNLQKTGLTDANKRTPNIWDITHQLYAVNLLSECF